MFNHTESNGIKYQNFNIEFLRENKKYTAAKITFLMLSSINFHTVYICVFEDSVEETA